jgi:hypothetical protein
VTLSIAKSFRIQHEITPDIALVPKRKSLKV